MFFIVYKGAKGLELDDTTIATAFAWALGLGFGCGLLMIPTVLPYMKKNIAAKFNDDGTIKPVSAELGEGRRWDIKADVVRPMTMETRCCHKKTCNF